MNIASQALAIVTLLGWTSGVAWADGGQIRASESVTGYQVTVFTSPQPLRAGPIDVSVLVQNVETGEVAADAKVIVEITSPNQSLPPLRAVATADEATNKLFRSALFELPSAGEWNIRVASALPSGVTHATQFAVDAAAPLPAWLIFWPWIGWPIVAIVLFVIHRRLVARRRPRQRVSHLASGCSRVADPTIVELSSLTP